MKIKQIATAAFIPVAIAGVAVPAAVAGLAGPTRHGSPVRAHRTAVRPAAAHGAAAHTGPGRARLRHGASAHAGSARAAAAGAASSRQAGGSLQAILADASSFEQCVAWRESTDTPTDPDGLFGILPSIWASLGYSGTAGEAPVAVQQAAFSTLYAEYGAAPWAPSDGC